MSPCPKCGAKGSHLFVLASWETKLATVQHRCPSCGVEWSEEARDPVGAVKDALGISAKRRRVSHCNAYTPDGAAGFATCDLLRRHPGPHKLTWARNGLPFGFEWPLSGNKERVE